MPSLHEKWSARHHIPEVLTTLSVALLLVLQFLWLRVSWQEAREDFRSEASDLFRNTLFAMHDSLMFGNIEAVKSDTTVRLRRLSYPEIPKVPIDSSDKTAPPRHISAYVEVFASPGDGDSLQHILRPLVRRLRTDGRQEKFFIRMGPDSLRSDSIREEYSKALSRAGLDVPFEIHHVRSRHPGEMPVRKISNAALTSGFIPITPFHHYAVSFPRIDKFLARQVTPQILFSLFVTLLTLGSFYLMIRNIRTQKNLVVLKNDLISNISHELKTPVATVSVALEALEKFSALDDHQKTTAYLQMAQTELRRLTLITEKILEEASFESGAHRMTHQKFNLDIGVREVLRSMQVVLERHRIKTTYVATGSDFVVSGNASHLTTVLFNLVDNAVKYRRGPAEISITLTEHATTIALCVKDNGIGIPAEYHKKIFEKFFRVPTGDTHDTHGHGLGLSYVARVMADHRGEIRTESEPGKGSSFTLTFPKNP